MADLMRRPHRNRAHMASAISDLDRLFGSRNIDERRNLVRRRSGLPLWRFRWRCCCRQRQTGCCCGWWWSSGEEDIPCLVLPIRDISHSALQFCRNFFLQIAKSKLPLEQICMADVKNFMFSDRINDLANLEQLLFGLEDEDRATTWVGWPVIRLTGPTPNPRIKRLCPTQSDIAFYNS